jgi:flavin-dependent dehydrogenase
MKTEETQVLVVGGGPGGSTVAGLLARNGLQVTLVERDLLPRYHIGESLLPSCLRIFDLLGVREQMDRYGFVRKNGGYFDWGGQKWEIDFGGGGRPLYGFQVIRGEFDRLLFEHARRLSADAHDGIEVAELVFEDGRPVAARCRDKDGAERLIRFGTLVDASGRAGLLANRYLRNRHYHEAFRNVAVWGYWNRAKRLQVGPSGAIATCSIPFGWIWGIPLHNGALSVGVVMHKSRFQDLRRYFTLDDLYCQAIGMSEVISRLVEGGELAGSLRTETDYSYAAERFAEPGYFLVGDAACFLDPLLSTGVHLATFSGMVAAASITSLLAGDVTEREAAEFYSVSYRSAYLRMLVVVSSFYQTHEGRDAYFREAQRLTRKDYSGAEMVSAFRNIISGVEDLADIEVGDGTKLLERLTKLYGEHYEFIRHREQWGTKTLEEINRSLDRMRVINAVQEEFSLTEETAVNGLYIVSEPRLRLQRAASYSEVGVQAVRQGASI